jgi:hypothetical protein
MQELRDSTEAKALRPGGFELPALALSNEDMAGFSRLGQSSDRSSARDREQAMFGAGFSFAQTGLESIYGNTESKNSQVYLASNLTPNLPTIEQPRHLEPVQSQNINSDSVAWDPREWAANSSKQAEHKATQTVQDVQRRASYAKATIDNPDLQYRETPPKGGDYRYPHRGREDDFVSYPACAAANMPFENIRMRIGVGPGHIDPNLIAGIIRNEQFFYKQLGDVGQDNYVRAHGNLDVLHDDTYSIGPAQIQIRNAKQLLKQFPEQLGQYKDDPLRALQHPGDAPMFVAAYMSKMINHLETGKNPGFSTGVWNNIAKHWKDGDANGALMLAFNPDPDQLEHIGTQLKIIESAKKNPVK